MKDIPLLLWPILLAVSILRAYATPPSDRLIQFNDDDPPVWLTEAQVQDLIHNDLIHFIDITGHPSPDIGGPVRSLGAFPPAPTHQPLVRQIISRLNSTRMREFITWFSAFQNRYYTSSTGVDSSAWLQRQVQETIDSAKERGYGSLVTVRPFPHAWEQNSVIARIQGVDNGTDEVIVLGAHQDSVNAFARPPFTSKALERAPGSDDDASGSGVLLETFRALLESDVVPRRSIEFQWYAAEEAGLRGSQDIAADYKSRGVDVFSMIQFDVVGFQAGRREIGIVTDHTDPAANQFVRALIDEYCEYKWTNMRCGYGCSDHASWNRFGYRASCPVEIVFNPAMHTTRDAIDAVNMEQVGEFAKLAVGYSVELAEPQPATRPAS